MYATLRNPCYKTCPLAEQYIILELSRVLDLIYDQEFFCFRCRVAKKRMNRTPEHQWPRKNEMYVILAGFIAFHVRHVPSSGGPVDTSQISNAMMLC